MWDALLSTLSERWPELLAAFVFTFLGTRWSRLLAHRRLRARIAFELIETQRAMRDRAAPIGGWSRDGAREEWMLEPYVMRVDFLVGLANAEGLGSKSEIAIRGYLDELRSFIRTWSTAKYKSGSFRDAYDATCDQLDQALRALGQRRRHRQLLAGLRITKNGDDGTANLSGAPLDPLDARPADAEPIRHS